mmetsp:Transcript_27266/g.64772  ORF Transcript_27266/g.64772 Transcript_27266/m.64772 type:complete len:204 (+) Transcript_27266:846-1457(+)
MRLPRANGRAHCDRPAAHRLAHDHVLADVYADDLARADDGESHGRACRQHEFLRGQVHARPGELLRVHLVSDRHLPGKSDMLHRHRLREPAHGRLDAKPTQRHCDERADRDARGGGSPGAARSGPVARDHCGDGLSRRGGRPTGRPHVESHHLLVHDSRRPRRIQEDVVARGVPPRPDLESGSADSQPDAEGVRPVRHPLLRD